MDIKEAIRERHSVRQFKDQAIDEETRARLNGLIETVNEESNQHFQLICDDPECFNSFMAHYGKFKNVRNYIAVVANTITTDYEERCGFYGQQIVLEAQMLGLNTCWVGGTFSKGKCKAKIGQGEKLIAVIAIGYGETPGVAHKSKPMEKLCTVVDGEMPDWFREGMEAAMMAPTAINQQKFVIELRDGTATIMARKGPFSRVDLGIVVYNFEAASGHKCARQDSES